MNRFDIQFVLSSQEPQTLEMAIKWLRVTNGEIKILNDAEINGYLKPSERKRKKEARAVARKKRMLKKQLKWRGRDGARD